MNDLKHVPCGNLATHTHPHTDTKSDFRPANRCYVSHQGKNHGRPACTFAQVIKFLGSGLTVLTVSSGGLSLMSVMEISAVAVLDKPKFKLPSMSVAWTIIVYWETFWREK